MWGVPTIASWFMVALAAFMLYVWLESRIAKAFQTKYKEYSLKSFPFFSRSKYLSYLLFAEALDEDSVLTEDNINKLVEWEDIRNAKIDTFSFLNTPGVLLVLTLLLTLFIEYLKLEQLVKKNYVFLITIIILAVLWLCWTVSDLLKTQRRKNLEICRFLKWYKLDR